MVPEFGPRVPSNVGGLTRLCSEAGADRHLGS